MRSQSLSIDLGKHATSKHLHPKLYGHRTCLKSPKASQELPNGAYWLPSTSTKYDVVYGQDFVLQRCKRNGPGLVVASKDTKLDSQPPAASTSLAVRSDDRHGPLNCQRGSSSPWNVTDITEYSFLGDAGLLPGSATPFLLPAAAASLHLAGSTCTGIILHPAVERSSPPEREEPDLHPRRTKKVKFTCKLCGTTSIKRVSPHGWTAGTVFAQCEGCSVVHKLVDNLNIIHELIGPVFPKPLPKDFKMPPGLPQAPQLDYHRHPALYKDFPEE